MNRITMSAALKSFSKKMFYCCPTEKTSQLLEQSVISEVLVQICGGPNRQGILFDLCCLVIANAGAWLTNECCTLRIILRQFCSVLGLG